MNGDDELGAIRELDRRAAHLGNGHGFSGEAARSRDAERDDRGWFDEVALAFEPDLAALDLIIVRSFVQSPLAAHLMFEMLDCIGDERVLAGDAGVLERGIENA